MKKEVQMNAANNNIINTFFPHRFLALLGGLIAWAVIPLSLALTSLYTNKELWAWIALLAIYFTSPIGAFVYAQLLVAFSEKQDIVTNVKLFAIHIPPIPFIVSFVLLAKYYPIFITKDISFGVLFLIGLLSTGLLFLWPAVWLLPLKKYCRKHSV